MSRDLEPSVEYGSQLYDIVSSCLSIIGAMRQLARQALDETYRGPYTPAVAALRARPRLERALALMAAFGSYDVTSSAAQLVIETTLADPDVTAASLAAALRPYRRLTACTPADSPCCAYDDAVDGYAVIWALRTTAA
jgi:hypothetical protein